MARFIFITGGVVLVTRQGHRLRVARRDPRSAGLDVTLVKLDPYINVDPGTMSPFQHGEVFRHRRRRGDRSRPRPLRALRPRHHGKRNNFTTGQIYWNVLRKEAARRIPRRHRPGHPPTSPTRSSPASAGGAGEAEICLVEIGGTVGDIESLPFLETIRQMRIELGERKSLFIHLTLVPYIGAAGELKTKPTQHSVKELALVRHPAGRPALPLGAPAPRRRAAQESRSSPTSPSAR